MRGARRRTAWEDDNLNEALGAGARSNKDLLINLSEDETRGATVTRLIGSIDLTSQTVAGAWGTTLLDIGIQVVSADAFNAAAVPDAYV